MVEHDEDFRIEQTYGEIRQAIEDAAFNVLCPTGPEYTKLGAQYAEQEARRIAAYAVMSLDAADPDPPKED